jgi:leucyl aminopeptidase
MTLNSTITVAAPEGFATPFLAVLVSQGGFPESLEALDLQTGGALRRLYATADFTGKRDESALIYPTGPAGRVLLVGLGKREDIGRAPLRRGAAVAAKLARKTGVQTAAIHVASEAAAIPLRDLAQVVAEGAAQGAWLFDAMKQPPEEPRPILESVTLLCADAAEAEVGHRVGEAIAAGQILARELQVLPANVCTPDHLATTASELARRHGFGLTVLDRKALEKEGLGAILAVGGGSGHEPRLIALEYAGAEGKPVVLVGKGITFDTGGISIKPAERMEDMKYDMSGAAAVIGTFEMLGRLKPAVHVVGLIPTAENMVSGTAYRPGDIVKSHLGKTIEVINTDAEGRLILADALSWARRYDPACVVDAATLTGAVVIGLGHAAAAVLGTDAALVDGLRQAAERAGERVWEMPFWDDYREHIKSEVADMKNSGGRPAGTITAAWFLREFAEGYPWAHLDIAGTAYTDRETPASVKGPTGMGVRLFSEFLLARG